MDSAGEVRARRSIPPEQKWGFPREPKFALAETWLGRPLAKEAEPGPLILRYLAAFGPAKAADVQTWSGLQGLRDSMENLRPQLNVLADEKGRELFDLPGAPLPSEDEPASGTIRERSEWASTAGGLCAHAGASSVLQSWTSTVA